MAAGLLRKRVSFEREVREPDGAGGYAVSWRPEPGLTVWARYQPERGRERVEAGRLQSAVAGLLTVRSSPEARNLGPEHRVMIDGVPHQVRSIVNEDQREKYLTLVVERGVAT